MTGDALESMAAAPGSSGPRRDRASAEGPRWPAVKVSMQAVSALAPYARNARVHSAEQVASLAASMRKFGFTIPLLVRESGELIAGHGRLMAAVSLGYTEVPTLVAKGWTDEMCRAYVLADNQLALNSEWNAAMLRAELGDLRTLGVDLGALGFAAADLEGVFAASAGADKDPEAAPEAPAVPTSRLGDVWLLGRHRLTCGDSTDLTAVGRALGGALPHLMVTDPPYGVSYDPGWRTDAGVNKQRRGKVENDDRADWAEAWRLFPGSVAYVWHGGLHAGVVQRSLEAVGFAVRAQIVWVKSRPVLSRGAYHWQHEPALYATKPGTDDHWRFEADHEAAAYAVKDGATADWRGNRKQSTVWNIENPNITTGHGTQKPVECMRRPIENNSDPGDFVYEPFSGSGTTIIAGEMAGRIVLALELSPAYVDVAVRRWEEFTGKVATLEAGRRSFADVALERSKGAAA